MCSLGVAVYLYICFQAILYNKKWSKGYYRLAITYKAECNYDEATQQLYEAMTRDDQNVQLR